jgi:hypothetical protein
MTKKQSKRPARKPRAQFAAGFVNVQEFAELMREMTQSLSQFRDEQGRRFNEDLTEEVKQTLRAHGEKPRVPGEQEPPPDRVPRSAIWPPAVCTEETLREARQHGAPQAQATILGECMLGLKGSPCPPDPWASMAAAPHVFANLGAAIKEARLAIGAANHTLSTDTAARLVHATTLVIEAALHTETCGRGHQRATQHYREELKGTRGILRELTKQLTKAQADLNTATNDLRIRTQTVTGHANIQAQLRKLTEEAATEIGRLRAAIVGARRGGDDASQALRLRAIPISQD